ncbi:Eukaryotic translation initiation factor 5 [Orchesella cincta]|uniref:Eukaryotic translation initiation factor 5 n=1 Tax=Orchesella cincta TaxID=48709 RepID=A0A1D2N2G9_ORCCI|nr:Eukaryotic translation initiation factor 5 [Orchesella cincta]
MSLNVNRSVSDMFYRYKMPKLLAKVEGKGNGIKTVIVNMVDVAKALGRPPTYPTKYFGCELGAQTQFDFKDERFIVNGSHEASKLQDLLDGFIQKFVLCPECSNPETVLSVQAKKGILSQKCKACGYSGVIKGGHRLIQYIIKNPPEINPAAQGSSLTERKERKRNKKQNGENGSPRPEDDDDFNDTFNGINGKKMDDEDDDDDWAVDVSAAAVEARQKELSEGVAALAINEDSEKPEKERMDIFYKSLEAKLKNGGKYDDKELVTEAERLDIRAKATLVLAELFFNQNIAKQVIQHRVVLLRFCHQNTKAQKYLIGGIEQVIDIHRELLPKVALILKAFYEVDILDEEVLIEWHSKVSKKYVSKELSQDIHSKAEPFIKWLKEAEEESSEEEEEADDVEIEYDDRARITKLTAAEAITPQKPAAAQKATQNGDEDDDLDIDAI